MGRVLQVVGYQDSGKTTFVVEYIKAAVKLGLKVGTIKHHGHKDRLSFLDNEKDTGKHRQAGAIVSTVEGNGTFILTSEAISLSLNQFIFMYNQFDLDIILVEGFKSAPYPKVVLLRTEEDLQVLDRITNVSCIVTRVELPERINKRYKVFQEAIDSLEWLLTNKVGENID